MDGFESAAEVRAFEQTLMDMGINPKNMNRKEDAVLPPLPASDPSAMRQNHFNTFYNYGSREFWGQSEVNQNEVKDFQRCMHYLAKRNNEAYCTKCHAGWIVNDTFQVLDGKLYNGNQELNFCI